MLVKQAINRLILENTRNINKKRIRTRDMRFRDPTLYTLGYDNIHRTLKLPSCDVIS